MKSTGSQLKRVPEKKRRDTAWTDFCRILICGVGCFLVATAATHYFDEGSELTLVIVVGAIGLGAIGLGVFASAKDVESW